VVVFVVKPAFIFQGREGLRPTVLRLKCATVDGLGGGRVVGGVGWRAGGVGWVEATLNSLDLSSRSFTRVHRGSLFSLSLDGGDFF